MRDKRHLFTSESVAAGHPDKICDQISDSVLDSILRDDPEPERARCACETMVTTGLVMVAGEITTQAYADIPQIVRDTVRDIGYDDPAAGFDYRACGVITSIKEQSPDIAMGVNREDRDEQGAGDQGLMFGYACDETPELMPAPILYAHQLGKEVTRLRKAGVLGWLRPDSKTQVSCLYEDGVIREIVAVVISTQHAEEVSHAEIKEEMTERVIRRILPENLLSGRTEILVNPTGKFVIGGPVGDCGLTGRKIIVDTYGGMGRHGGGAFSGKDPSKVDRSAAYMCRWVAKNVVAAELADRCELQVAYAIGHPRPVSIHVDTFGTNRVDEEKIEAAIREVFSFKPADIVRELDLLRPIYRTTTNYGHFGREDAGLPWEEKNRVTELKSAAGA